MFSVRSTKRKGLVPVAGRGTSSDGPWQKRIPRISLEDEETVARKTKPSRSLNSPGGRKEVVEDKAGQPEKKKTIYEWPVCQGTSRHGQRPGVAEEAATCQHPDGQNRLAVRRGFTGHRGGA